MSASARMATSIPSPSRSTRMSTGPSREFVRGEHHIDAPVVQHHRQFAGVVEHILVDDCENLGWGLRRRVPHYRYHIDFDGRVGCPQRFRQVLRKGGNSARSGWVGGNNRAQGSPFVKGIAAARSGPRFSGSPTELRGRSVSARRRCSPNQRISMVGSPDPRELADDRCGAVSAAGPRGLPNASGNGRDNSGEVR